MKLRFAVSITFIVLAMIILNTSWHYYLQNHARDNARLKLNQVRTCVNLSTKSDVVDKLEECATGVTTTATGDIFAYNTVTRQFVFDASTDCHKETDMRMTEASICSIHADPLACKFAMNKMDLAVDSSPSFNAQWKFDDGIELLEWVVSPHSGGGVRWLNTGESVQQDKVIIALGIQVDELEAGFERFDLLIKGIAFLGLLFCLVLAVIDKKAIYYGLDRRDSKKL